MRIRKHGGFREQSNLGPYLIPDEGGVQDIIHASFGRILMLIKDASTMTSLEGANTKIDFKLEIDSRTLKAWTLGDHGCYIFQRLLMRIFPSHVES